MNYYDETLNKIKDLIKDNKNKDAISIIEEELRAPYLPKEFNEELLAIYEDIRPKESFVLNDEEIKDYLFSNKEKQLVAVDYLNKKNLRDYLDLCNEYLCSDGYENAKALLVDSLIRHIIYT